MQVRSDKIDAETDAGYQTERLQRVGPDQRLDAAPVGIEPHEDHRRRHVPHEGHMQRPEYQQLHHETDQIDPHGGPDHFRQKEEPSSGPVRRDAETALQILVDRHEPHPVKKRNQHERDHELPRHEPERHLQIGELAGLHPARNRHESHSRDARSDHRERDDGPGRAAVANEKALIVRPSARQAGHEIEHQKISDYGNENGCRSHEESFGPFKVSNNSAKYAIRRRKPSAHASARFSEVRTRCPLAFGPATRILRNDTTASDRRNTAKSPPRSQTVVRGDTNETACERQQNDRR